MDGGLGQGLRTCCRRTFGIINTSSEGAKFGVSDAWRDLKIKQAPPAVTERPLPGPSA